MRNFGKDIVEWQLMRADGLVSWDGLCVQGQGLHGWLGIEGVRV